MPPPSQMTSANFRADNPPKGLPSSFERPVADNRSAQFGRTSDKTAAVSSSSATDFMGQADGIMRRIMKCVAIDDPNIKMVTSFVVFFLAPQQKILRPKSLNYILLVLIRISEW